jgi:hypothetical protein
MTIVQTDVRTTRPDAHRLKYMTVSPLTATNVEDAINQVQGNVTTTGANPPQITPTTVVFAQSPYTVQASDNLLLVDTTGGAVVILLPASASRSGKELDIKDSGGNAAANPISVTPVAGETVDNATNAAPYPIDSNYAAVRLRPRTLGYAAG